VKDSIAANISRPLGGVYGVPGDDASRSKPGRCLNVRRLGSRRSVSSCSLLPVEQHGRLAMAGKADPWHRGDLLSWGVNRTIPANHWPPVTPATADGRGEVNGPP
jgi:hypothetical protein